MPKNSMGQFISILRKANGLTQQDVADRLGVSNKAVSRWERDETAPDLFLIPALAEMFDITCDELLRGERIINEEKTLSSNNTKQIKALIGKTLSNFKTLSIISISLSLVGFILFIGISYGYYKPIIAFSVMFLFLIAAFVLSLISVNKLREIKNDDEVFSLASENQKTIFNKTLGNFSFFSFFTIFSICSFSAPMIIPALDRHLALVLGLRSFLEFNIFTLLFLLFIYLYTKEYFVYFITNEKRIKIKNPLKKELNII